MQKTPIRNVHQHTVSPIHTQQVYRERVFVTPERHRQMLLLQEQPSAKNIPIEALLEKQRKKTKALEATLLTTSTELKNLQLQVARLKLQADQSESLLADNGKKTQQVMFYQDSLDLVRKEVQQLTQSLQQKSKDVMKMQEEMESVRNQSRLAQGDRQHLTRMIASILDLLHQKTQSLHIKPLKQSDPLEQVRHIVDSFSKLYRTLQQQRNILIDVNEKTRREYSDRYTKEKEKSIRLQYEKRLLEDRQHDQQIQLEYRLQEEKDRRIQVLQLKLLHLQQQSQRRLQQVSLEKFNIEDRLIEQSLQKENSLQEHSQNLMKRIKELEKDKKQLKAQLQKVKERYKNLNEKYNRMTHDMVNNKNSTEYINFMKQMRQYEEEKKASEIMLEEMTFQNRVLEEELAMYRSRT